MEEDHLSLRKEINLLRALNSEGEGEVSVPSPLASRDPEQTAQVLGAKKDTGSCILLMVILILKKDL
jgi:hypothetical protein